jgi:diguanylate cyclase (GGDEF)-like protein
MSTLFEKYSTYYNMRKLAEELAASLSVTELCDIVVNRSLDFIHRGDLSVLSLAHPDGQSFPVMAYRYAKLARGEALHAQNPSTDIFDHWVIKNRRRLIITDSYQDFRFDAKEAEKNAPIRSLIVSPLVQDARVIGLLRINAHKPEAFSNDDLRLLDNIAMLAAAALSNAILYEQTKELAIKDFLTGLFVRRYFFERLKDEHRRALTTQRPLSLLMCDLDHFKQCNDQYGHGAGDQMLIHFSRILKETAESAIVARYGGEEFSVLLPETDKQNAFQVAQKIRTALKSQPFIIRREKINTTVSIGVSNLPEDAMDYESLIQTADRALYEANKSGRDSVC